MWRKHLKLYNSPAFKLFIFGTIFILLNCANTGKNKSCIFAQTASQNKNKSNISTSTATSSLDFPSLKNPEISGMQNLKMPKISAPTFSTGFYKPSFSQNKLNNQKKAENELTTNKSNSQINLLQKNKNSSFFDIEMQNEYSMPSNNKKNSSKDNNFSRLSASDIVFLSKSGLLDGIYELNDVNNYLNANKLNLNTGLTNSNSEILQKILKNLEDLKNQQENLKKQAKNIELASSLPQTNKDTTNKSTLPSIIRWSINGSDILAGCKTIYFSSKESDGTFLLTGDRKYIHNNETREETFYFLFRTNGNGGILANYNVEPKIIQDIKNEQSEIFKMTQKKDLIATKTGNLISLKCSTDDLTLDMLIDIGSEN